MQFTLFRASRDVKSFQTRILENLKLGSFVTESGKRDPYPNIAT